MTKLESARKIISQEGRCAGVNCGDCPLHNKGVCELSFSSVVKKAQEYIDLHSFGTGSILLVSNDKINWKERELSIIHEGCYICYTKDREGFKCWRYAKKTPKTEIWYQYLFKTIGGYAVTPHTPLENLTAKGCIRIYGSAKEVEV